MGTGSLGAPVPCPLLLHSLQHFQLEPELELGLRPCLGFLSQNSGPPGRGRGRAWREENRTAGRVCWSRQGWGPNWEFLGQPQCQVFCPIV